MKRLQIISMIILVIGIICILLWLFVLPEPSDWLLRIPGLLILISIFTLVFSTVRINKIKK
jgi:hypothetical protein